MKKLRNKYHCNCCKELFQTVAELREHPCMITQHTKSIKMVLITMEYMFEKELNDTIKIVE